MTFPINPDLYIIAGPSASGKSSYALNIASQCNGAILNADSMQVYRDLQVLSAQPCAHDMSIIPHHGYGVLDANDFYSAGTWWRWINDCIKDLETQNRPAFIVGGTGLYLKTLTHPFMNLPDIDPAIRHSLKEALNIQGLSWLYSQLSICDPTTYARLSAHDTQRIIRALEVYQGTGKPLSYWQSQPCQKSPYRFKKILILPDRQKLYQRADERVVKMFQQGAIAEVSCLVERNVPLTAPIYRTIGSQPLYNYIMGQLSLDQAIILTQQHTRNYIKRQFTWFKNQFLADQVIK